MGLRGNNSGEYWAQINRASAPIEHERDPRRCELCRHWRKMNTCLRTGEAQDARQQRKYPSRCGRAAQYFEPMAPPAPEQRAE